MAKSIESFFWLNTFLDVLLISKPQKTLLGRMDALKTANSYLRYIKGCQSSPEAFWKLTKNNYKN